MHFGLLIYGSLNTLSGGYMYDRRLLESLRLMGDTVEIISLPWRSYPAHLADNHSGSPSHVVAIGRAVLNTTSKPPHEGRTALTTPHPHRCGRSFRRSNPHPSCR
jgi:hypothetical protein